MLRLLDIVLAADGSKYTKKALAFLVTHESLAGPSDEVIVVHVQPALPPRVRSAVGAEIARSYQTEEAEKVLRAYRLYLAGSAMSFERGWLALHQVLATRPDGDLGTGHLRGAQSAYPFQRGYMYPAH